MTTLESLKEIERIKDELKLDTIEIIEESIQFYMNLYNNEEYRRQKLENKANILISASAIVMVIITAFFCFMLYDLSSINLSFLVLISIIYIFIALFIHRSVSYSLKSSKLKKFTTKEPGTEKYNITNDVIFRIKKFKAINYYLLYHKNQDINDKKEQCINIAQDSLMYVIIVLLFLFLAFVLDTIVSSKINIKHINKIKELMQ
jgi:hypothetical protein